MPSVTTLRCACCARDDADLKRCTRCYVTYYCSPACQAAHWTQHKAECNKEVEAAREKIRNKLAQAKLDESGNEENSGKSRGVRKKKQKRKQEKQDTPYETNGESDFWTKVREEYDSLQPDVQTRDETKLCASCMAPCIGLKCSRCKGVTYCSRECQKSDWKRHKETCEERMKQNCYVCNKPGSYLKCARCKIPVYCSRDCQKTHWKSHKAECVSDVHKPSQNTNEKKSPSKNKSAQRSEAISTTSTESEPYAVPTKAQVAQTKPNNITMTSDSATTAPDVAGAKPDTGDSNPAGGYGKLKNMFNRKSAQRCEGCGVSGQDFSKCARCKSTAYCSKKCQQDDWSRHKKTCERVFTEEEKRIIEERQRIKNDQKRNLLGDPEENEKNGVVNFEFGNYFGHTSRFWQNLTPEQCLVNEKRQPGSLQHVVDFTRTLLSGLQVLTSFDAVPWEPIFPFQQFMLMSRPPSVLVAFMTKYHEHVMRHGVYLDDCDDKELHVEFYFDHLGDNPAPFWSYSDVQPGGYIVLLNPVLHVFGDGVVGFRVNYPQEVKFVSKKTVKKLIQNAGTK